MPLPPTFRSTPTPLTKVHSGKVGRFSFDPAVSEITTDYWFNRMGTTARATGTSKTKKGGGYVWVRAMVFNATLNDISIISWWLVLLVEETGVLEENHQSTFRKSLTNFITWCCIEYTSPWAPLPRGWRVERLLIYHIVNGLVAILIKGRWPLVPRRQGYMVSLNFKTTVN